MVGVGSQSSFAHLQSSARPRALPDGQGSHPTRRPKRRGQKLPLPPQRRRTLPAARALRVATTATANNATSTTTPTTSNITTTTTTTTTTLDAIYIAGTNTAAAAAAATTATGLSLSSSRLAAVAVALATAAAGPPPPPHPRSRPGLAASPKNVRVNFSGAADLGPHRDGRAARPVVVAEDAGLRAGVR